MKRLPSSSTYAGVLAFFRIVTGILWISHALPKFMKSDEFMPPNGMIATYVAQGLQHTGGAYHAFLANTVQPNIAIFAELVRLGEATTGILLLLGLFTRFGGLLGMLLTLNYLSARQALVSSATLQSLDFTLCVLSAINLVLPTGLVMGVDAIFARKRAKPHVEHVRAEFVPEPPLGEPQPTAGPPPTSSTSA